MPHRTHNCPNTLMIMPQLIINTYVSLMLNFLKKIGNVLTSKSVGTGPLFYEKRIYRAAVSQRLRNTGLQYCSLDQTESERMAVSCLDVWHRLVFHHTVRNGNVEC